VLNEQGRTAEAEELWTREARDGNTVAAVQVGVQRYQAGDLSQAEYWWREAGEKGNSQGAYNLGRLLNQGDRKAEAEGWWRKAAEQLDPTSAEISDSQIPLGGARTGRFP
jgi:uncharacterized protein